MVAWPDHHDAGPPWIAARVYPGLRVGAIYLYLILAPRRIILGSSSFPRENHQDGRLEN